MRLLALWWVTAAALGAAVFACSGASASLGSGMREDAGPTGQMDGDAAAAHHATGRVDGGTADADRAMVCETSVTCPSALVCTLGACAAPTGAGDMTPPCVPPAGACDGPSPIMSPYDVARGCVEDSVVLRGVCDTSVDRCTPSLGLGFVCAFAPDGGVFFGGGSDNQIFTAKGWRFSQCTGCFPDPSVVPDDELATPDQEAICAKATCAPACPGSSATSGIHHFGCSDAGS